MPARASQDDKGAAGLSLSEEWSRGRDTIDKCDERIQDIRKQGLTFLTGLLSLQAVVGLVGKERVQDPTGALSFALLVFSLLVILAARLFEKQSQLLQAAAASRCLVIESYLATELTGTISDRHLRQRWPLLTGLLYLCFGAVALVLQQALGGAEQLTFGQLGLSLSAGWTFFLFVGALLLFSWVDLRSTMVRGLDWSVSRTAAGPGDLVQVRVVNLDTLPRRLPSYPQVEPLDSRLPAADSSLDGLARQASQAIREAEELVRGRRLAAIAVARKAVEAASECLSTAPTVALETLALGFLGIREVLDDDPRPPSAEEGAEFQSIVDEARRLVERVTGKPAGPATGAGGWRARARGMLDDAWWGWVDLLPGKPEQVMALGTAAAVLAGRDRIALGVLLAGTVLAGLLVVAAVSSNVGFVSRAIVRWPLGGLLLLALARLPLVGEALRLPGRQFWPQVAALDASMVALALALPWVVALALAVCVGFRLAHATMHHDPTWPQAWRWSRGKACYLPPQKSFVWTVRGPSGATVLGIRLDDEKRASIRLGKQIVVQP